MPRSLVLLVAAIVFLTSAVLTQLIPHNRGEWLFKLHLIDLPSRNWLEDEKGLTAPGIVPGKIVVDYLPLPKPPESRLQTHTDSVLPKQALRGNQFVPESRPYLRLLLGRQFAELDRRLTALSLEPDEETGRAPREAALQELEKLPAATLIPLCNLWGKDQKQSYWARILSGRGLVRQARALRTETDAVDVPARRLALFDQSLTSAATIGEACTKRFPARIEGWELRYRVLVLRTGYGPHVDSIWKKAIGVAPRYLPLLIERVRYAAPGWGGSAELVRRHASKIFDEGGEKDPRLALVLLAATEVVPELFEDKIWVSRLDGALERAAAAHPGFVEIRKAQAWLTRRRAGKPEPEPAPPGGDLQALVSKAATGSVSAMLQIGEIYLQGHSGSAPDPTAAWLWFYEAARLGSGEGCARIGDLLLKTGTGIGVRRPSAYEWYQAAGARGSVRGLLAVARGSLNNDAFQLGPREGRAYLRRAAFLGSKEAKDKLYELEGRFMDDSEPQ